MSCDVTIMPVITVALLLFYHKSMLKSSVVVVESGFLSFSWVSNLKDTSECAPSLVNMQVMLYLYL